MRLGLLCFPRCSTHQPGITSNHITTLTIYSFHDITIYIYSHTHQLINSYTLMQTQPHTQSLFFFLHYFSVCILFLSWKHIQKVTLTLVLSRFKLLPLFLSINIRHFSTFYRLSSLNVLFLFLLLISRYTFSFKKNCFYFHSNE